MKMKRKMKMKMKMKIRIKIKIKIKIKMKEESGMKVRQKGKMKGMVRKARVIPHPPHPPLLLPSLPKMRRRVEQRRRMIRRKEAQSLLQTEAARG